MARKKDLTPEAAEIARLEEIFEDIAPDKKRLCAGLIVQAARLRVLLDKAYADIEANGDTEMFSQSANTEPYERERPVARLFNSRDKNYQTTIKLLIDLLPEREKADAANDLMKFALAGKK